MLVFNKQLKRCSHKLRGEPFRCG